MLKRTRTIRPHRSRGFKSRHTSRTRLGAEALEPRIVLDSTVVFNELMYNPPGETEETAEWIELHNQLHVDMDLSEWELDGGVDYKFPDGTIIPAQGYLLVAASPNDVQAPADVDILGPYSGMLSNGGEEIRLYNNGGRLMNTIDYNDGGSKWPIAPDGSGVTLAKRSERTASEDFASWTSSAEIGGTPGKSNFGEEIDDGEPEILNLVPSGGAVRVLVPSNGDLGMSWIEPDFDDSAWQTGNAGVGFDTEASYDDHINLDVEDIMHDINRSIYVRMDFTVAVDPADMQSFFLQMQYDDGFVAYLNGTEIARANAPGNIGWDSRATTLHPNAVAVDFVDFNVTPHKDLLNMGNNVLAIHGLDWLSIIDDDFLISPQFGYVAPEIVDPTPDGTIRLAINEVSPLEGNKFVEIANYGSTEVDLEGMVLRTTGLNGGDYVFPAQSIAAGGKLVLTEAELGVTMANDEKFFLYTADQPAPNQATVVDARPITGRLRGRTDDGQWLYPDVATPGADNSFDLVDQIVINEIMYHHQPQLRTANTPYAESTEEWIELYNRGETTVDLTGWEVRDAVRFDFADGTTLGPGDYLVVAQDPVALRQAFPGIDIVGPFDGTLRNSEDRISLVDGNSNPADLVQYFDSGQWDEYADGGGSSLELRDPDADNSIGAAWAASDESTKATWESYINSKVATEPLSISQIYHEFIFGMLDSGEFLIDNLSLKGSNNIEVVGNGDFESDAINATPSGWRFYGNHSGTVVADPDDPSNNVLHVVATGPQQHVHDHVEIPFSNGQTIQNGQTYTVSFDARWIAGSRQFNNRMYFTRAGNTIIFGAPQANGTPGAANSQFVGNLGPTYTGFGHAPVLPEANEPVTVTVSAADPQGVASMELYYNQNGGAWTTVPMTLSGRAYTATIPGQSSGQVIQFYVQGVDALGAASAFPAAGPNSRALYEVNDGQATNRPIETFRIVLLGSDNSDLFSQVNRMSNNYVGGTLIVGNHTAFYDVGVRQIGSRYIRPNSGYKVKLSADDKYLGIHKSLRFDINELGEILMKQMVNRAAGTEVSMYDDISYMVSPQHGARYILLNLARYESVYLEEQFQDGSDGTKFEQDDITYPTAPNGQGFKTDTGVSDQDIRYRGTDPEAYRGQLLIKNNRAKDDYEPIAEFARVINLNGAALDAAIDDVMDVDLWMRHYATQSFLGNWDTYGFRRPKNIRLYLRPKDGKVIPLFWDADLGNYTEPLIYNGVASRLDEIRNIPRNTRLFWGHMLDLVNRSFNSDYAAYWAGHYSSLGAGTASANTVQNRANQAIAQAMSAIPVVNFSITSNGGNPLTVDETYVTLRGDGWIDVREVRLLNSDIPLKVMWTDTNSWEINVPLALGQNDITLEAFDFEGNQVGVDSITVTTTATQPALRDQLRITEINYNPIGPDETEFLELMHAGLEGSSPIDLAGVRFTDGIDFEFPAGTSLAAGERIVVVSNQLAFEAAYGQGINIAGEYTGALNNGGEIITLVDTVDTVVQSFEYNDNWYPETDGGGYSLTIADPTQERTLWDSPDGWRLSEDIGGSPGIPDDGLLPNAVVINEISNNDTAATGNWLELHNRTDQPIVLDNWYLSDDELEPMKYQFAVGTTIVEGGFIVLDETTSFGNAAAAGVNSSFVLSELGGVLWLNSADENGEITPYQIRRSYGAAEPDATQGIVRTSDGLKFATLTADTRAGANQGPVIGPIVINEIMYNPASDEAEFIELQNVTSGDITLNNGAGQAWQLVNGIDYTFPAGEVLPTGGFALLVQGEDGGNAQQTAANFRSANNVPASVAIYVYEPTANGSLDNSGEEILLVRPSTLVAGQINVDEIDYEDSAPWPAGPDGTGPSLSKLTPDPYGNEPSNWGTGSIGGTPGRTNDLVDTTPPSKPSHLVSRALSDSVVALAWMPSFDNESGISHYVIYRDDEVYATSPVPFFVDENATFQVEPIRYQVLAVNGDALESNGRSNYDTVGSEIFTFQQGTDGYTGVTDVDIRESAADTNRASEATIEVGRTEAGGELISLFRWENLAVPAGRTMLDAWFTINVSDGLFNFTGAGNTYDVARVLRNWTEDQVTWNEFSSNQSWQTAGAKGTEDRGPVVGQLDATTTGTFVIVPEGPNMIELNGDGMAMVQEWIDDPSTNHGILIADRGDLNESVSFDSKEAADEDVRPALSMLLAPFVAPLVPGDFTLDDEVTTDDVSILCGAIRTGATNSIFDLDNSGGAADLGDMNAVLGSLATVPGDSNLDGRVDSIDLNAVGINWLADTGDIGWTNGDFTCDGRVNALDLNEVGINWQFGVPAPANIPRAPLAASLPIVQSTVSDMAIVDVLASDLAKTSPRGLDAGSHEATGSQDATESIARWRSQSQRTQRIARRSDQARQSQTPPQLADDVFQKFDLP